MSDEAEIGKEMLKEEKLAGISDTAQNNIQVEQIPKNSTQIADLDNDPSHRTISTDITERTHIQETAQENEQKLKAIIQGLSIAAFIIDGDHQVIYWNKALEALSNIHAEEIVGTTNHWKAFYAQERPCILESICHAGSLLGILCSRETLHGRYSPI